MRRTLTLLLLLALAAAGCATNGGDGDGPTTTTTPATGGASRLCVSSEDAATNATQPTWVLETTMGTMRLTLHCDKAPATTQNIVDLTEMGYYDGIKFHRVIARFMNQAGDPLTKDDQYAASWGTGGPSESGGTCSSDPRLQMDACKRIPDEFYCADGSIDPKMNDPQYPGRPVREQPHQACGGQLGLRHDEAGVLSMANAGPESGGSQFFITAAATPHLDGAHPVFGKVADASSLEVVLAINGARTDAQDRPVQPISITKATIDWG